MKPSDQPQPTQASASYPYDVAISYAGEQRAYVEQVANILERAGVKVFYDRHEQVELWGKDLVDHLSDVYQKQALYVVVFASADYERKAWTNLELRAARARAVAEKREYILPARFDDTEIPGLLSTICYIDLRGVPPNDFAQTIRQKLRSSAATAAPLTGSQPAVPTVGRDENHRPVGQQSNESRQESAPDSLSGAVAILADLNTDDLEALYLVLKYEKEGLLGTFSAELTTAGLSWLQKVTDHGLIRVLARRDEGPDGLANVVTLTLTNLGRAVIAANETEPLERLCTPTSMSAFSLFDVLLADDLSWKCQVSDGLLRLRKNRPWLELLRTAMDCHAYTLEHENSAFYTRSVDPTVVEMGNVLATMELNRRLRVRPPLTEEEWSLLVRVRSKPGPRPVPYKTLRPTSDPGVARRLARLEWLDLVGFKAAPAAFLVIPTYLGTTMARDGHFEDLEPGLSELFTNVRPIDE